jgi:POT family proton-dependent oligopeptide transporter
MVGNTINCSSTRLRRDWFGQPRGLTILFLTETWEKFSFFGMRALLMYYMTKELLIPQHSASYIYGMYTAFVYFTPIVGGIVSDRWLGRRRSILAGGTIMAAGSQSCRCDNSCRTRSGCGRGVGRAR